MYSSLKYKSTCNINMKENKDIYNEKLNKYLSMKKKYKNVISRAKKSFKEDNTMDEFKQAKFNCIGCKRRVNTIFGQEDNIYYARCGSKDEPCPLDIRIHRGEYINIHDHINTIKEKIEESKEEIMRLKLDVLFGFMKEEEMIIQFKEKKMVLQELEGTYIYYQEQLDVLTRKEEREKESDELSISRETLMEELVIELDSYNLSNNKEHIANILLIYKNIIEKQKQIRDVEYDEYYIDDYGKNDKNEKEFTLIKKKDNYLQHVIEVAPVSVDAFRLK